MKNKKQIAFNKIIGLFSVLGIFLAYLSYFFVCEKEKGMAIGFGIVAIVFIVVPFILTPVCYFFDKDGVTLKYLIFSNERYLWKNIHSIEVIDDSSSNRAPILSAIFFRVYQIGGKVEGETKFYMNGHIRKSFRTKKLLEKYWDGTITGYFGEGTKKWWNSKVLKKKKQVKAHIADEVVVMEREARARLRENIKLFEAQVKQLGLEMRTKYVYTTKDFDELNSRPEEGYTYTALIEICRPGETDEEKTVLLGADLLFVRLGKTAYKGVVNDNAIKELEEIFTPTLEEIRKNGIEVYCGE